MKKIIVSLTAASLIVASAAAADKGIDIVTTGQTALYYQTVANNGKNNGFDGKDTSLLGQNSSQANVGVQLNLDADLKNDFTFGSQLTYLGTTGLEKNLVSNTMQNVGGGVAAGPNGVNGDPVATKSIADEIALTQIYIAKKIANTTVKLGRQELPMALSPLAFSEDWNVFKNTFEAALVVNSDIPNTTLVGAYVGKSNKHGDLANFTDTVARTDASATNANVAGTAYMITAQNKSLPMSTITASYYSMAKIGDNLLGTPATGDASVDLGANAIWADVAIADKSLPMGLALGLQAGQISPDHAAFADTTAMGVKASIVPASALTLTAAYTTVSGDDDKVVVAVKNVGTGVKTPLYTQMVLNQDAIALDANTFMLKGVYSLGDLGSIIAQGTSTTAGKSNLFNRVAGVENDCTDLELLYTVKAAGVNYLAGFINQSFSEKTATNMDSLNAVRVWARYNF